MRSRKLLLASEAGHMRFICCFFAALGFLVLASIPTLAAPPVRAAVLSDGDRADLGRIEAYLNAITSLRARFFQVGQSGETAEGKFLMQRPGKMRFEYEPPSGMLLISTGSDLIVHDAVTRETSFYPLSSTPLVFLSKPKISFDREVTLTGFNRSGGQISVSLRMSAESESGELTLVFADHPLSFHQWTVRDAQDRLTRVTLSQIESGVSLDKGLFQFVDPRFFDRREN